MGSSSSGKKHKKDKKHRHRHDSYQEEEEVTFDLTGEGEDSRSSHHRHHHKHKKHKHHKYPREDYDEKDAEPEGAAGERSANHEQEKYEYEMERRRRHEEHRERRHHHHHRQPEVIDVQESDSDSSDCVEVPVDESAAAAKAPVHERSAEKAAPRPPSWTRETSAATHRHTASDRERDRSTSDVQPRDRGYDRDIERERERIREREREKERRWDEREGAGFRERDRERERERTKDSHRSRELERQRTRDREYDMPPTPPPPSAEGSRTTPQRDRKRRHDNYEYDERSGGASQSKAKRMHSPSNERFSPIPENGAGDCLSIEETNKLRAKLGLKPLEVDSGPSKAAPSREEPSTSRKHAGHEKDLSKYKDEWGEFLHKPADNIQEKKEAVKIREKLKERKEKRALEERLRLVRTLGDSDDEVDDLAKWVERNKRVADHKKEAEKTAKALEELDAEFGVDELVSRQKVDAKRKAYTDKHLKGLKVEHDVEEFSEGKSVILTLKDKDVLDEETDDTLVNVNMLDNERYRKNVEAKKQNPLNYGYNVYEEQYDEFGNPIERSILEKYDDEIAGKAKKRTFVIGENLEEEREHQRKLLEIKTKLAGKRLETLTDVAITLATDTFTETEMATFKKPKKKVKKLRQRLKAEDLVPLNDEPLEQHLGSRSGRRQLSGEEGPVKAENVEVDLKPSVSSIKEEAMNDEDDDLQRVLAKARKLKQKENLIKKALPVEAIAVKQEVETEIDEGSSQSGGVLINGSGDAGNIILNETAEFCRTLGDIPTYGMAGNRNEDLNDMMDFEDNDSDQDEDRHRHSDDEDADMREGGGRRIKEHGTWNSVNPDEIMRPADLDLLVGNDGGGANGTDDNVAILDEEPDVGAGVANALRLALSKGYLEKEEKNRPSNSKMAHLQAKNYSIEDKSAADDEKVGRRDRFHAGPSMDFRDKDNYKPNVKLEYIDDNGRILNLKEAFRYLSHKFHGKGPGKNKIEKRLQKMEQEGLMKTMSSTDTPLGTLTMLQQKQKETKTPFVVLSGGKQNQTSTTISKYK